MAGVKGRSGGAHGGPQYNPANVNGRGGNGQSGDYTGFAYGQNQALAEQKAAAPLATSAAPAAPRPVVPDSIPQAVPLTAPTQNPDEPITAGVPVGAGPGPEALNLPQNTDTDTDKQRLLSYLPALEVAANQPTSSQAFRNYVRLLKANIL
jgi:hypothetical protein